jgi:hypothetical protein
MLHSLRSRLTARFVSRVLLAAGYTLLVTLGSSSIQRRQYAADNPPYDGSFTFTRIAYGGYSGFRRGYSNSWAHDYPAADRNMHYILDFFTYVRTPGQNTSVLTLDDPAIFRAPLIYISEPGFWAASDEDLQNLRTYVLKGGMVIFDDFEADQWYNMADNVRRALPEYEWIEIGPDHKIFQSFFQVDDIYVPHPLVSVTPRYWALFEDNDPNRRIMVLANHNSDLAEYWEWSGRGFFPLDMTNEAFKLGVNYIVYSLTH